MKSSHCFRSMLIVLVAALFFLVVLTVAHRDIKAATPANEHNPQKVFLVFDGPWAFAPDPEDVNKVIALAPKADHHRELFVQSYNTTLTPGIYDLSFPTFAKSRGANSVSEIDPDIVQAKIGAQNVQRALDSKFVRYAIRLPKPEAYVGSSTPAVASAQAIRPTLPPKKITSVRSPFGTASRRSRNFR